MEKHSAFGEAEMQARIDKEIRLAKHIGVVVEAVSDAGVTLRAPLSPNSNHKGTAFGGSLYSVAVLSGWAWLTRYLVLSGIKADAVIQESNMKFVKPVHGEFKASLAAPPDDEIERFLKMLKRAGRGRITLSSTMHDGEALVAQFEGVFAAALRR
ncbi:MAG TPA: YiiD C-terminal domain-containing protein [Steroidobacteraceae bacterium]